MISYTMEEMGGLIEHLKSYKGEGQYDRIEIIEFPVIASLCKYKYAVLIEFLEMHYAKGSFDLGLTIPESVGCQVVTWELKEQFPDFLFALEIPDEDLPLNITDTTCYQYPVTVWRLSLQRRVGSP